MALEAFMRFLKRQPKAEWITYTTPAVSTGDLRTTIMVIGVWLGFAAALHSADSSLIYAAVDHFNHAIDPRSNRGAAPSPLDHDALIVTRDHTTELTSVATLSPRGFHPVISGSPEDALIRVHSATLSWKLVVIDASLPGSAALTRTIRELLPSVNLIGVRGKHGSLAISSVLMEHLAH